jgi:hypothetical protein
VGVGWDRLGAKQGRYAVKASFTLVGLLLTTTLVTSAHSADAMPSASLPGFCQIPSSANVWQGRGVGPGTSDHWEDAANWSTGAVPGTPGADPDACIPAGGVPRIVAGEEEHLTTLDVQDGATVSVNPGGKLFLYGAQSGDADSVVRKGGRIVVVGGTLGGIAKLHVGGTLVLKKDPAGATTLLTRDCSYDSTPGPTYPGEESCPPATPVAGPTFLVEVDDMGIIDVQGGGLNLGDQTRIIARGILRVRTGAYVAADHGTRLELRPHRTTAAGTGTLRFEGDGGYLEGKITADTGISTLSRLINQGLVVKSGGTGRTLVSASYSQPGPGKVSVRTGTLLLPTGPIAPAYVGGGVTYGTGRCAVAQSTSCAVQTTPSFRQSADFQVPSTDTSGANVVVSQLSTASSSADLGRPFELHATSLAASASSPAIIRMGFDASVLGGKHWQQVQILRQATTTSAYVPVTACLSDGQPQTGEVACVDRRDQPGSSRDIANASGNPDVVMVIRTSRTSRWVGR